MSRETMIGIAGTALALAVAVMANLANEGVGVTAILILVGFVVLVASIVFGLVVPWAKSTAAEQSGNRPAKTGMVLSVLGFISIVAFWSGLPVILGAGGAALGQVGRENSAEAGRSGLGLAALVVGVIVVVAGALVLVLERLGI